MKKLIFLVLIFLIPLLMVSQDYEDIKISDLPGGVREYVDANMPGGKIVRALKGTQEGRPILRRWSTSGEISGS